jgi:hypothetical protein
MKLPHQNHHAALAGAERAALEAQATLDDPGLRAAFKRLQEHYINIIRHSAPEAGDDRDAGYYMLRALDVLATDLQRTVTNVEFDRRSYRRVTRNEERTQ